MISWQPILDGPICEEALRAVDSIALHLRRSYEAWPLAQPEEASGIRSVSLASGRAGVALFHAYYERWRPVSEHPSQAARFLNEAVDLMAAKTMNASLFCGFTGLAWTMEQLTKLWGQQPEEDPNEDVDEVLLQYLEHGAAHGPYDLIDGVVGIGVYALERLPRPLARRILTCTLDRLEERSLPQQVGRAIPSGVPPSRRYGDTAPEEYYNLGLSHGNPGVVALLGLMVRHDIEPDRANRLLADIVEWLLSKRLAESVPSVFSDFDGPELEPKPARTAWCYGDPGVAAALLLAGQCTGRQDWQQLAVTVAHKAASRPVEDTSIVDIGLCHGAAGVAHVFHRIHRTTGDPRCGDASRFWFERCLDMRRTSNDIAGFSTWSFERVRDGEFVADPCWLAGAAGVGLALLSASTTIEPAWDRSLLLSAAPFATG